MCVGYKEDWYPVVYLCVFWVRENWGKVEECRDSWEGMKESLGRERLGVRDMTLSFFADSHPGKLHYNSFSPKKNWHCCLFRRSLSHLPVAKCGKL